MRKPSPEEFMACMNGIAERRRATIEAIGEDTYRENVEPFIIVITEMVDSDETSPNRESALIKASTAVALSMNDPNVHDWVMGASMEVLEEHMGG